MDQQPGPSRKTIEYFFSRAPVDDQSTSTSSEASRPAQGTSLEIQSSPGVCSSSESEAESEIASYIDGSTQSGSESCVNVHVKPYQPKHRAFPKVSAGNSQSRSFQQSWYKKWPWLEWDDEKESAFCHPCRMAAVLKFELSKKAEQAFSTDGFQTWKNATHAFRKHESSRSHRDAIVEWAHYTKSHSVAAQLVTQLQAEQERAQLCLLKIISTLKFLARQGLPLRGHQESEGNFIQLLHLRSEDSPELLQWLEKRSNWTSHEIQNEIIELMAHSILRKVMSSIRANNYYSIIVDEATDCNFKEQVSICFRHVDTSTLEVHEEFVGLHETDKTTADTLTKIIKDVIC